MKRKYKDVVAGVFFILFGAVYFLFSFSIRLTNIGGAHGSRLIPQIVAILLMAMGLLLALRDVVPMIKNRTASSAGDAVSVGTGGTLGQRLKAWLKPYRKVLAIFVLSFAYTAVMELLGFIIATPLYLLAMMKVLTPAKKKSRIVVNIIISAIATAALFFMFRYGFSMILPKGIL